MRDRRRHPVSLALLLLAGLGVLAPAAHARKPRPPLCNERFVLDTVSGLLPDTAGGTAVTIVVSGKQVILNDACTSTGGSLKPFRDGWRLRANWKQCGALTKVRFTGTLTGGCTALAGKLRARKQPTETISAHKSRCGDLRLDRGRDEECDTVADATCVECKTVVIGTPTTTTTTVSTTTTPTTTVSTTTTPTTTTPTTTRPASCEVLNAASCLLPYPSSHFLVPADTATGVRLNLPQEGLPAVNGPTIAVDPLNTLDGFSPGVQILMHFPQGVDPARSNASRLLPPNCCDQPAGPPWIDTRTHDARSLDDDSPTVLLDAGTGERIVHFIEPDARAAGNPARQLLFLRPGRILTPGHRYIVAMRHLVAPNGTPVVAETPFAALRDGIVTGIPAIDDRRTSMDAQVFAPLATHGIRRDDLVLAFDFVVGSDGALTREMLAMRDQAYAWLATVEATPAAVTFTVDQVTENDCNQPGQAVWRYVRGTFESPLFLTADLSADGVQFMHLDATGTPTPNGVTRPAYTVSVPCSVRTPAIASRPVLFGHGLGQTGDFFTSFIPPVVNQVVPWTGIGVATDWRGLSGLDLGWVATRIIGVDRSELHNFQALPARLRQGMLNTLVLARMMKRGLFNRHDTFRVTPGGRGVFPGPAEEMVYYGVSLGGIMGTYLAGLTPDIERFGLDVPAVNFSCMLQRAQPFSGFDILLPRIGITDPLNAALGITLLHELWASAEPVSVVHHITRDPLPGAGGPKRLLVTEAFLDKQVSNQCTEIEVRTLGIPNLLGSVRQQLVQIPDVAGPVDSAFVSWHLGELDILNPAHQRFIPPLANVIPSGVCDPHPRRPTLPAGIRQLIAFMQPGGVITNTCTGICDGATPDERSPGPCTP